MTEASSCLLDNWKNQHFIDNVLQVLLRPEILIVSFMDPLKTLFECRTSVKAFFVIN